MIILFSRKYGFLKGLIYFIYLFLEVYISFDYNIMINFILSMVKNFM